MRFEIRFSDESVASVEVEAESPEEARAAFEEMDAHELRRKWLEATDAGNFVVERVEPAGGAGYDVGALLASFDRRYGEIYDGREAGRDIEGMWEAFAAGEDLLATRHPAIGDLARARGDGFDGSAEVAALYLAFRDEGLA